MCSFSCLCIYVFIACHRLWIIKDSQSLPLDVGVCAQMLWTGVLRTREQSFTNVFCHPKSSQMEGPVGLFLGLRVQHQAGLEASIGKLMWFQGIALVKIPYIKLLEKIGNIPVFAGFHHHQNTLFTIPQEKAITKKIIYIFLKSIFMFVWRIL